MDNIVEENSTSFFSYENELEGQRAFYERYLPRVDSDIDYEELLADYSDGVINGCILEFKLILNQPNEALFQAIKYLSAMRLKGKNIPYYILLVSINMRKAYLYHSSDFISEIEQVYSGGASRNNEKFISASPQKTYNLNSEADEESMIRMLREVKYTPVHIDENCIVGWAERFYTENPGRTKADFIGDLKGKVRIVGEIRNPSVFKGLIYPYKGATNKKFEYLMDKLNDFFQKKNLGAFYTPLPYAQKAIELLRTAISRVPEGNDYIILDRCAGTGNLERLLTKEEQSHCIVSTIEYYEYKVLLEVLGDRVRHIIPPTEKEDTFNMGLVRGADALSKEYLENEVISQYVNDEKCTVILFENPPYSETTSLEHQKKGKGKTASVWKESHVVQKMREEVSGSALNDLSNAFIWSAFKYYLRQPTDSYIVFSPIKYWKAQHLINKEFAGGYAFNRKHFHTSTNACILCVLWTNINSDITEFSVRGFDIDAEGRLTDSGDLSVKRIFSLFSKKYYEKDLPSGTNDGILTELNGLEVSGNKKRRIEPFFSPECIGYIVADSAGFDNPDAKSSLLVAGRYNGNGFYVRRDNYLTKLPVFAASRYIRYNGMWTERGRIMKSGDGFEKFKRNIKKKSVKKQLLKILLFACLEPQNHMRTFMGSDGRFYRNEICLDTTNGETLASTDLKNLEMNEQERELVHLFEMILNEARKTENYNPDLTYGVFQIKSELNTSVKNELGKTVYNYPLLNGHLTALKNLVRDYYNSEIVPWLFEYEFLK